MKKKSKTTKPDAAVKAKNDDFAALIMEVRSLVQSARRGVASVVNSFQVMTNFEIGRRIVDHEQKGAKRATYGAEVLKELSARLTEEFGRGFSRASLEYMRKFFLTWQERMPQIPQAVSAEFLPMPISETVSRKSPFLLSWSHYVELLGIKDPEERSFYEIESANSGWNVRELRRQKASCLYERLALSRETRGRKHLQSESSFRDISANLLTKLQNFVSFARDHRFFSQELPIFSG